MTRGFLDRILPAVRDQIAMSTYLSRLPADGPVLRPSLARAIRESPGHWAVLVERKHRSPGSRSPELPASSLQQFVRDTSRGGATGLSCLATQPHFGGDPAEVALLAATSARPVLFKDFIIDPIQVEAARRSGASAILLIARLETEGRCDTPLAGLADAAHRSGLEVLLEFHTPEEVKVADSVAADVYGVNVRNLDTLALEPELARATLARSAPRRPILLLSGVDSAAQARSWREKGADGILVGSGFARAADPVSFLAGLRSAGTVPRGSR